jgi:uncharacterized repeat protein (TIGR03803 family)
MTVSGRKPVSALLMRLLWAAALVLPAFGSQAAVVLTTLHSFSVYTNGTNPNAGLVQGSDGNFYGTTDGGGTNGGCGTVFKISTNGVLTSLHSFTGGNDGIYPNRLVQGTDGDFYGTTYGGGAQGWGTVFRISGNGVLTTLHSFAGDNDGGCPQGGLVQGTDGDFYGTTSSGGGLYTNMTPGLGTVFKISTNGVLTKLYSFTGGNDGYFPRCALVQGSDGNFYGTTSSGGTNSSPFSPLNNASCGTVFKISTAGELTSLYSFTGGDGNGPSSLVQGSDGNFYGTTSVGGTRGAQNGGYGTVFRITTNGALTTLHFFDSAFEGQGPVGLVEGSDGYFYGTTDWGGTNGNGTVFKISANGVLTNLYSFTGTNDGSCPNSLVKGSDGSFYGTTARGGNGLLPETWPSGNGTVFKITTNGALTSLYLFAGGDDGANPSAGLVEGRDGSFYGTTEYSQVFTGSGTVFKITTNGVLTTLHLFNDVDGWRPNGLAQGNDGYFYGTTGNGGTNGYGTVFKISPTGTLTSLYCFGSVQDTNGPPLDGMFPMSALVQASDGYFYGTTGNGGTNDYGTVFKISPTGTLTSLYCFGSVQDTNGLSLDGMRPMSALVQASDGYFYGTTGWSGYGTTGWGGDGTVFKINTNGVLTTLYSFGSVWNTNGFPLDGASPNELVQGSDGNFYGTTEFDGFMGLGIRHPVGNGTVFKISPTGVLTTLYAFGSITNASGDALDGAQPTAGLVQGNDGYFYGTTGSGGTHGNGTVFIISTNGALTTLYSFTGGDDGRGPNALMQGTDGSFYGTTSSGGAGGAGTVFRLTIVPDPPLNIIPSGPYVILTWPTDYNGVSYAGYTLQSTTNLVSSVWSSVSPSPVVIGGLNMVVNPISGTQQFFRLAQ